MSGVFSEDEEMYKDGPDEGEEKPVQLKTMPRIMQDLYLSVVISLLLLFLLSLLSTGGLPPRFYDPELGDYTGLIILPLMIIAFISVQVVRSVKVNKGTSGNAQIKK